MFGFKDGYSPKIQGAFEDPIYTYISVTVMPCHLSQKKNRNVKCAPQQEIENVFWLSASTISLWVKEKHSNRKRGESGNFDKWHSRLYESFIPEQWLGLETYFIPKRYIEKDEFGYHSLNQTSADYDSKIRRTGPVTDNGYLRFYLRMSDEGILETGTVLTVSAFVSQFGGLANSVWGVFFRDNI